jgi:[ribosomal protein S18]-alanine N-acetyltransferase
VTGAVTGGPRLPLRVTTRLGEVELRPLRWWHLAAVGRLERRLFPTDPWSDGMFWSELAEAGSRWYVTAWRPGAPHEGAAGGFGELVGYAGLLAVRPELVDEPGDASVQTIGVAPELRRAGLGRVLLRTLLAEAMARDSRAVFLEVRVDNEPAQALYRDHGFEPVGVRRRYYQPEGVDALVMRLDDPAALGGHLDGHTVGARSPDERNGT